MKKIILSLAIALSGYGAYAQNSNPWPASGDATFGTDYTSQLIKAPQAGGAIQIKTNSATSDRGISLGLIGNDHVTFAPFLSIGDNSFVGIGTTTPATKIEIKGTLGAPATTGTSQTATLRISNSALVSVLDMGQYGSAPYGAWFQATDYSSLGNTHPLVFNPNGGNVGIGTSNPDQALTVNGTLHAKEVKVDTSIPVPDYVFAPAYKLPGLTALKKYVDLNHHLPEVPSAAEVEKNALNLSEMNLKLLKKAAAKA